MTGTRLALGGGQGWCGMSGLFEPCFCQMLRYVLRCWGINEDTPTCRATGK